jgi:Glycosyl hydrolase catalytic core
MHRRKALQLLATLPLSAALPVVAAPGGNKTPSAKKGWAGGDGNAVRTFGASWYYTWWNGGNDVSGAEFVPMIKHGKDIGQTSTVKGMSGIKAVLGFNEPERKSQGNTTIDEAIKLWPQLVELAVAKNIRLGSPAPSSDKAGMDWLTEFMRRARKEKLRVDFIAIHWYRGRDASAFATWLKELDRNWRLPVWLTEFNGWSGSERENHEFLKDALKSLERAKFVERYAYFEPGKGKEHSLFKADGSLSRMGELYRDAGT